VLVGCVKLLPVPRERKTKPLSPDYAALAQATTLFMREAEPPLKQDDVATASGLSAKQVSEICRGQANPTYLNLLKLAKGLDTSLGQLATRADEMRKWL
jgi:hypothetical protein